MAKIIPRVSGAIYTGGRFFGASYIHKLPETFVSILHTEMSLLFLKVDDHGR